MNSIERLYQYADYRTFLRDFSAEKKQRDSRFSYGVWARQLNLKSPSTLVMVLNGQRHPGPDLVKTLSRYFRFDENQDRYFDHLVRLAKADGDPTLTVLLMEKLSEYHPRKAFHQIDYRQFQMISNWHYYAVRELVHLADFQDDARWMARRLGGSITPKEAKLARQTLLELGLLAQRADGRLIQTYSHISTPSHVSHEALTRYHEQVLAKAQTALRVTTFDEREVSGTTFAISVSSVPKAKELIRKFRLELCKLLEDQQGEEVYQFEVAFFPLTTSLKEKE